MKPECVFLFSALIVLVELRREALVSRFVWPVVIDAVSHCCWVALRVVLFIRSRFSPAILHAYVVMRLRASFNGVFLPAAFLVGRPVVSFVFEFQIVHLLRSLAIEGLVGVRLCLVRRASAQKLVLSSQAVSFIAWVFTIKSCSEVFNLHRPTPVNVAGQIAPLLYLP